MSLPERLVVNSGFFDIWRKWSARRLLRLVKKDHKRVLEIGCGKGTTTRLIRELLPRAEIVATDFDFAQVTRARNRLRTAGRIHVQQADASKLKFKDESFDAIFAFLTFHHIGAWRKALSECFRVLAQGGILYVDDLELKPFPKLQHFFFPTDGIFSRGEFIDALKHAGLTILVAKSRYKFVVLARKPIKRSFVTKV